jgi:hypothetical protein
MNLKKLTILTIILCSGIIIYGQQYRLTTDIGYSYSLPVGDELNKDDGIETISLFKNFSLNHNISANVSYSLNPKSSIGIYLGYDLLRNWENPQSDMYQGASGDLMFAGPMFKYCIYQLKNSIKLNLVGGPVAGRYELQFQNPVFEVIHEDEDLFNDNREEDLVYGLQVAGSAEKELTPSFCLNLNLGVKYLHLNSYMCTDRNIFLVSAGVSVSFKKIKNKTYYIF